MADEAPEAPRVRLDKGADAGEGAGPAADPAAAGDASRAWPAPVSPGGPGETVLSVGPVTPGPAEPTVHDVPAGPSVHDQRTVAAVPGAELPAEAAPQAWANPFAAPSDTPPPPAANPFAAPCQSAVPPANPFAAPGPQVTPSPYAPPAPPQGVAVPPPPIAPDGPGQVPYGYPGAPAAGPMPAAPGYGYPGPPLPSYPGGPGGYGGWPGAQLAPNNGMGTASMITGIISAIGFCMVPVAVVTGVLAIILGVLGRARVRRGEATNAGQALAGIICGAAGLVLAAAFIALIVFAGSQD
ncbi:DUF4190 domain-containing protein [Streptomyces humi]|uniref:DUF4190 domain-containing protein n=1 Tax=Streptomyces humi TaxID=1428620 RepID=UPI000D1AF2B0|nr:DUF4190 domain-containing protein [Streptomyces humi]